MQTEQYAANVDFPTDTEGPFYGIISGNSGTVTIEYDPSQVPAQGLYEWETVNGSNGNITFAAGTLTFTAVMDNSNTVGWPIIQFDNAQFAGLSYYCSFTENGVNYIFAVNGLDWQINNAATNEVVASGTINNSPS